MKNLQENKIDNLWTKEQAVRTLLLVIDEGNPTATLNAVKQLNAMFGYTENTEPLEEGANSIEIAIVQALNIIEEAKDLSCLQE